MERFSNDFLLGAATAAHQVEGNNVYSDYWALEQMKHSSFAEPSLDAVNHYNQYQEDIDYLAESGLNAYRFSVEWARIEPEKEKYNEEEIQHYRKVLEYCRKRGVEPIVTMHHFSSPKWLIREGGWESENTIPAFAKYCEYVVRHLGHLMKYVCTINEANMGLQLAVMIQDIMKQMNMDLQIGMNLPDVGKMSEAQRETMDIFGTADPHTFLSPRTEEGDRIIMCAHEAAREAMKHICPHLQIGITLSLHDIQVRNGGEERGRKEWENEFLRYVPYLKNDDFLGIQNYTRKIVGKDGTCPIPDGAERTQMDYEFYPQAVSNVIRKVYSELPIPIIVTENGVATDDDTRRNAFIMEALRGVRECVREGIPVKGYCYWSLLDNFEWQKGYDKTFGLIAVDRKTQKRYPKESLSYLGTFRCENDEKEQ